MEGVLNPPYAIRGIRGPGGDLFGEAAEVEPFSGSTTSWG